MKSDSPLEREHIEYVAEHLTALAPTFKREIAEWLDIDAALRMSRSRAREERNEYYNSAVTLKGQVAQLQEQLESLVWSVSPAMMQAQIDQLNLKIIALEETVASVTHERDEAQLRYRQLADGVGVNEHDPLATVSVKLQRQLQARDATIAEQEAYRQRLLDYVHTRIHMAEQCRAGEVLAGNAAKEAQENGVLAELRGVDMWIHHYWRQATKETS